MGEDPDLRSIIERHEREIDELQGQVKALTDGYVKEQLEAELAKRMATLETEIAFQELQETMAKEEAEKEKHKHRFFHRR